MNKKEQQIQRAKQEDAILTKALWWIVGAVVLEALLLLLNQVYSHYTPAQIQLAVALRSVFTGLAIALPICFVLLLIWAVKARKSGKHAGLSAALAIRRGAHIRMTAFDNMLPPKLVKSLDLIADVAVCILGIIMLVVGWHYATTLGGRGTYVSMPWLSRFWMYFPVPLAGVAMIVFEIEAIYNHIKAFFVKDVKEVNP